MLATQRNHATSSHNELYHIPTDHSVGAIPTECADRWPKAVAGAQIVCDAGGAGAARGAHSDGALPPLCARDRSRRREVADDGGSDLCLLARWTHPRAPSEPGLVSRPVASALALQKRAADSWLVYSVDPRLDYDTARLQGLGPAPIDNPEEYLEYPSLVKYPAVAK